MTDKLNITIRIAGLAPFPLSINRADEELIRNAEYNVNELWRKWCGRFKDRTPQEVMGMVAFQFAKLYFMISAQAASMEEILSDFEKELDNILLKVD